MKLIVATCQFPVDRDIRRNARYVQRQLRTAQARGAHVAHFSEVCLSGYGGVEFKSYDGFDWDLLKACTVEVLELIRRLRLWVVIGSSHRLTGNHKPHNSLYIINDRGRIVDRYDKMFCTGDRSGTSGDLSHYSPGNQLSVFTIKGIRCGALICHDFRYQELYRQYKQRGVQFMFHSYHNGHMTPTADRSISTTYRFLAGRTSAARSAIRSIRQQSKVEDFQTQSDRSVNQASRAKIGSSNRRLIAARNIHGVIVLPTMQTYAANNYMWISSNNTSARESSWPSFFVRPDGVITGQLQRNKTGVLISTVDTKTKFYDASQVWRDRAMRGIYHSGTLVKDQRSDDRKCL